MGSFLCHCFSSKKKQEQFTPDDPRSSFLFRWISCCRVSSIVARLMGRETLEETIDDEMIRRLKTKTLKFNDYDEEKHSLLEMNITSGKPSNDLTAMNFDDSDEEN